MASRTAARTITFTKDEITCALQLAALVDPDELTGDDADLGRVVIAKAKAALDYDRVRVQR